MKLLLIRFLPIIGLCLLIFTSCKRNGAEVQVERSNSAIVDDELKKLDKEAFAAGFKKSGSVLIDVRIPQEFEQGHIEGATNINFFDPQFKYKLLELDREKTYYIYDKAEARSFRSMKYMEDNNFKHVFILKGGFKDWNTAHPEDEKTN